MAPKLEVCVDSVESILAANEGSAHRIELCSSLELGGLTPSIGLLQYGKQLCPTLEMYAMVRPRSGDFNYSDHEIAVMLKDIDLLKRFGANGFVFGVLRTDGTVDVDNCKLLLGINLSLKSLVFTKLSITDCAAPLPSTFHRAFDVTNNPKEALEDIIKLGFSRILTSGLSTNALSGIDNILEFVELARNRITIMAGAGINEQNLDLILRKTKINEFHSSASVIRASNMKFHNTSVSMGTASDNEYNWKVTSADKVKQLIDIAKNY